MIPPTWSLRGVRTGDWCVLTSNGCWDQVARGTDCPGIAYNTLGGEEESENEEKPRSWGSWEMSGEHGVGVGDRHQTTPGAPQPASPRLPLHRIPEPSPSMHMDEAFPRNSLRLAIRTPSDDAGVSVPVVEVSKDWTVSQLKQRLVEHGLGDREGMRIVWGGRFLEDTLVVGQVFKATKETQTVHLIARRNDGRPPLSRTPTRPTLPAPTPTRPLAQPPSSTTMPAALVSSKATAQASADALHYIYFLMRRHLCALLGVAPLSWDETEPKPVMSEAEAKRALAPCLRAWGIEVFWERIEDADLVEELKRDWTTVVGTDLSEHGINQTLLELDGFKYKLVLPPLSEMTGGQVTELHSYLHLHTILPSLINANESFTRLSRSLTTLITDPYQPLAPPLPNRTERPLSPLVSLIFALLLIPIQILPLIPLIPVLSLSAIKLSAMIWMLTRGMPWTDQNFIMLALAGFAYWCYEASGAWAAMQRARDRVRAERAGLVQPGQGLARPPNVEAHGRPAENIADPAVEPRAQPTPHSAADDSETPGQTILELYNQRQIIQRLNRPVIDRLSLFHLNTDNGILNLRHRPYASTSPTGRDILLATMFPASGERAQAGGQRLNWLRTQLVVPFVLWFVTLVPAWDVARRQEIRRRENEIRESSRVILEVAERDLAQLKTLREQAEQGQLPKEQLEAEERALRESGMDIETGHGPWSKPVKLPNDDKKYAIPTNLSPRAERYWLRVLAKTEGIDWEEEREAQERMGGEEQDIL